VLALLVYGDPPTARSTRAGLVPLGGALPLRDEATERALLRRLASELELVPGRRIGRDGQGSASTWRPAAALAGRDARALARFARVGALAPRFDAQRGGAAFALVRRRGRTRTRVDRARARSVARRREWVALDGGGFAELPADWLARHGDRVADLLAARGDRGALPTAALPELAALAEELGEPAPEAAQALRRGLAALADATRAAEPTLPADLTAALRTYQRDGVRWLDGLRELALPALLADDMGLGKTLQALCAMRGRTLVVAPTSVVPNWASRGRALPAALRVCVLPRSGARARSRGRSHAHELCAPAARCRRAVRCRLGHRAARRVAGDQERRQPGRARGASAARAGSGFALTARRSRTGSPSSGASSSSSRAAGSAASATSTSAMRDRSPGRRRSGRAAARARAPVRAAAPEARRRARAAAAHRERAARRARARRARGLRRDPRATRDDVVARFAAGGSAFHVLEALLRLRQAGLRRDARARRADRALAKLEVLRENLEEAVAEGHKALVFSQWTSLLDRVEPGAARRRSSRSRGSTARRATAPRSSTRSRARAARPCCSSRCARAEPASTSPPRTVCSSSTLVEPGGRGAGRRSRAPDRPDAARDGLPARHHRHRRGARARAPGAQARARRGGDRRG
jgi:hypothetical protein